MLINDLEYLEAIITPTKEDRRLMPTLEPISMLASGKSN